MKDRGNDRNKREENGTYSSAGNSDISSEELGGSVKDYISGDSTPSSSGHQFPWIATDPKRESKKSAMKTNS